MTGLIRVSAGDMEILLFVMENTSLQLQESQLQTTNRSNHIYLKCSEKPFTTADKAEDLHHSCMSASSLLITIKLN